MLIRDTPIQATLPRTQPYPVPLFARADPVDLEVTEDSPEALVHVATCYLKPTRAFRHPQQKRQVRAEPGTGKSIGQRRRKQQQDETDELVDVQRQEEGVTRLPRVRSRGAWSVHSGEDGADGLSSAFTVGTAASESDSNLDIQDNSAWRDMEVAGIVSPSVARQSALGSGKQGFRARRFRAKHDQDLDTANGGKPAILNVFSLPHMESICRESVQAAFATLETIGHSYTWRRMQIDKHERHNSRQQAANWRKVRVARAQREAERMQAQQASEEDRDAHHPEDEDHMTTGKTVKWDRILHRLRTRGTEGVLDAEFDVGTQSKRLSSKLRAALPQLNRKSKADMRIEEAKRARKMMERIEMLSKLREEDLVEYDKLSESDKGLFKEVFERNALVDDEILADAQGICSALAECGISGHSFEDRAALQDYCEEILRGKRRHCGEWVCDHYEFAVRIVPAVRQLLHDERKKQLTEAIHLCSTNWEGRLDLEQVYRATVAVLPTDAKPVLMHSEAFRQAWQEAHNQLRQVAVKFITRDMDLDDLTAQVEKQVESVHVAFTGEQLRIKHKHKLDLKRFRAFRSELIYMDNLFHRIDVDHSGAIDTQECVQLCSELGLLPRAAKDWVTQIASLMDSDEHLEFANFLDVVVEIRERVSRQMEGRLHTIIRRYQLDDDENEPRESGRRSNLSTIASQPRAQSQSSPLVTKEDLPDFMVEMGIIPYGSGEKVALHSILEEYHEEHMTHMEPLSAFCVRAQETIRMERARAELELATKLGFTSSELGRLRVLFSQVSVHASGKIKADQAHTALARVATTQLQLVVTRLAFNILDFEGRGFLDIQDFLRLVMMARNSEGPFRQPPTPISSLSELAHEDVVLILCCYKVPWDDSEQLSDASAMRRAATLLGISSSDNLNDTLHIKNLLDLYDHALAAACEASLADPPEDEQS